MRHFRSGTWWRVGPPCPRMVTTDGDSREEEWLPRCGTLSREYGNWETAAGTRGQNLTRTTRTWQALEALAYTVHPCLVRCMHCNRPSILVRCSFLFFLSYGQRVCHKQS